MTLRNILFNICLLSSLVAHTQTKTFTLGTDDFLLNNKPFQMISGEIHPARIPAEYWRHRIQMTKAMGCNTIAAYIFWNYHETEPGKFDFETGNKNINEFLRICKEESMWVLMRPGPYVCAEWDLGGIPPYLLKTPDIKLRCMDDRYMAAVEKYIKRFSEIIKPHLITNGGNILMVQIENEYGSYGNDKTYLEALRTLWLNNGINVPFYTADGATPYMLEAGSLPSCAIGLDSGSSPEDFNEAEKQNPDVPAFSSETYPGWLTHWGESWAKPDTSSLRKEVEFLLKNKKSVNFYVIHGGTNFGFTAGANAGSPTQYQPDLTSYDYDAPINEQGQPTAKYFMLRKLISKHVDYKIPNLPKPISTIEFSEIELKPITSIWNNLPTPFTSPQPKPMESFDQNQGLMLYKTKLIGHKSGKLTIREPHDYALVFLNNVFIDTIFRDGGKWTIDLPKTNVKEPVLEILVEGMGHINFAQYMIDRKGITDRVTLNGMTLMNWEIYSLPFDSYFVEKSVQSVGNPSFEKEGIFFSASFELKQPGDTYIDMSNFKKGMVYVNGINLGRYWNIGPQMRLYCPGTFLKKGKNEIIVFDLHQKLPAKVKSVRTLD